MPAPPRPQDTPTSVLAAGTPAERSKSQSSLLYDLGDDFSDDKSWSNKPGDMDLDTYFNPMKPNVGGEFGLVGLKPVLKNRFGDDYLLIDAAGDFYVWRSTDGRMNVFKKRPTLQEAIDEVLAGPRMALLTPKAAKGGRK